MLEYSYTYRRWLNANQSSPSIWIEPSVCFRLWVYLKKATKVDPHCCTFFVIQATLYKCLFLGVNVWKKKFSFLHRAEEYWVRHAQQTSLGSICLQPKLTQPTVIYFTVVSVMDIMALAHKVWHAPCITGSARWQLKVYGCPAGGVRRVMSSNPPKKKIGDSTFYHNTMRTLYSPLGARKFVFCLCLWSFK